ncbi:MAG: type II toxin-antitoxin system VapC family toxin [Verrucomicrobiae bacterium]|nr:type II toxin-antitoxin system VapC family toxin [Verrucomicrobiae bacterium]
MILPDINLLLYAHDSQGKNFVQASTWWSECLNGYTPVGLAWVVILGFIRISTNPRIYQSPQTVKQACQTVAEWSTLPHFRLLNPADGHWDRLSTKLQQIGTAGNLTTDAHLATLAMDHGCILHTTDADFSRFRGLKWVNPLKS